MLSWIRDILTDIGKDASGEGECAGNSRLEPTKALCEPRGVPADGVVARSPHGVE